MSMAWYWSAMNLLLGNDTPNNRYDTRTTASKANLLNTRSVVNHNRLNRFRANTCGTPLPNCWQKYGRYWGVVRYLDWYSTLNVIKSLKIFNVLYQKPHSQILIGIIPRNYQSKKNYFVFGKFPPLSQIQRPVFLWKINTFWSLIWVSGLYLLCFFTGQKAPRGIVY